METFIWRRDTHNDIERAYLGWHWAAHFIALGVSACIARDQPEATFPPAQVSMKITDVGSRASVFAGPLGWPEAIGKIANV